VCESQDVTARASERTSYYPDIPKRHSTPFYRSCFVNTCGSLCCISTSHTKHQFVDSFTSRWPAVLDRANDRVDQPAPEAPGAVIPCAHSSSGPSPIVWSLLPSAEKSLSGLPLLAIPDRKPPDTHRPPYCEVSHWIALATPSTIVAPTSYVPVKNHTCKDNNNYRLSFPSFDPSDLRLLLSAIILRGSFVVPAATSCLYSRIARPARYIPPFFDSIVVIIISNSEHSPTLHSRYLNIRRSSISIPSLFVLDSVQPSGYRQRDRRPSNLSAFTEQTP
jgi:hypothetical protein